MNIPKSIHPSLLQTAAVQRCAWPDCGAACCLYGVWIDKSHAETLLQSADLIIPWMETDQTDPRTWFDGQEEDDEFTPSGRVVHSTVLPNPNHYGGTACIFLRSDQKCALQAAAEANQMHPWRLKPFYCILHPLELDKQGNLTIDDLELMVAEPASCLEEAEDAILLTDLFKEEIDYLLNNLSKDSNK